MYYFNVFRQPSVVSFFSTKEIHFSHTLLNLCTCRLVDDIFFRCMSSFMCIKVLFFEGVKHKRLKLSLYGVLLVSTVSACGVSVKVWKTRSLCCWFALLVQVTTALRCDPSDWLLFYSSHAWSCWCPSAQIQDQLKKKKRSPSRSSPHQLRHIKERRRPDSELGYGPSLRKELLFSDHFQTMQTDCLFIFEYKVAFTLDNDCLPRPVPPHRHFILTPMTLQCREVLS